eukprot:CAMPEP_0206452994 /NCGR_PEP_ID=MMETSP0324_2-20121206/20270_1 /ASSEMBLY_ACC=CAM_ASM_000836 /TAXON_ID=2866 /ORGANISM="Crypthecodinium cohnii, Strain Seligo" /LENGTH=42 /DNA_ID= /DNA_START= /DNA_END= /DNA_ORIENTATION=
MKKGGNTTRAYQSGALSRLQSIGQWLCKKEGVTSDISQGGEG